MSELEKVKDEILQAKVEFADKIMAMDRFGRSDEVYVDIIVTELAKIRKKIGRLTSLTLTERAQYWLQYGGHNDPYARAIIEEVANQKSDPAPTRADIDEALERR
jgi:hypothetical protein